MLPKEVSIMHCPAHTRTLHCSSHFSHQPLLELFNKSFIKKRASSHAKQAALVCLTCAQNNPKQPYNVPQAHIPRPPARTWTSIANRLYRTTPERGGGGVFKYLLVAINRFTNCPMVWPCWTYKAKKVVKHLKRNLIPNFKIPPFFLNQIRANIWGLRLYSKYHNP